MAQVMTGARGIVKIGGEVVGFVGGVSITVENTLTDVDVMGRLDVGDLAETAHKCNFSVNYFKEIDPGTGAVVNAAASLGFDTSSLDAGVKPMRQQTYFNVEIEDEETGKTIYMLEECKYEGGTGQVDARGLWQGTWNFRAKRGYEVA